ncbi:MAG: transposase [Candidatus Dormibacteria bacterium]
MKRPSTRQRRYPAELRERAVRMVLESRDEPGRLSKVASQLGVGYESLRHWVKRAEIDGGLRPGVTSEEQRRIKELEHENKDLRRANEILKSFAGFIARELDPPRTRS